MPRPKPKSITVKELNWLFAHGYIILSAWIGPVEGTEYRLHFLGKAGVLAYRKSERACFNAAQRIERDGTREKLTKKLSSGSPTPKNRGVGSARKAKARVVAEK